MTCMVWCCTKVTLQLSYCSSQIFDMSVVSLCSFLRPKRAKWCSFSRRLTRLRPVRPSLGLTWMNWTKHNTIPKRIEWILNHLMDFAKSKCNISGEERKPHVNVTTRMGAHTHTRTQMESHRIHIAWKTLCRHDPTRPNIQVSTQNKFTLN